MKRNTDNNKDEYIHKLDQELTFEERMELIETLLEIMRICKETEKLSPEEKARNEWAAYDKQGNMLYKY